MPISLLLPEGFETEVGAGSGNSLFLLMILKLRITLATQERYYQLRIMFMYPGSGEY